MYGKETKLARHETYMVESLQEAENVWCQRPLLLLGPLAVLELGQIDVLQECQVNQSLLLLNMDG